MQLADSGLDVPPQPSATDVLDMAALQAIEGGNRGNTLLSAKPHTDVSYYRFRKPGVPGSLTANLPTPCDAIVSVLDHGPEIQVVRTDTETGVAVMQDPESVGDRAIGQFPGHSMCSACSPIEAALSVTVRASGAGPQPAVFRGLVNLRPEYGNGFFGRILCRHSDSPPSVAPRAVDAAPGYFAYCNFTTKAG
jgi:hypothetical protein